MSTPSGRAVAAARLPATTDGQWDTLLARFDRHFGRLERLLEEVYGPGESTTRELALLAGQLATSWQERPGELRALDSAREADPTWFTSQRMLGGVLYVDRYAGDLAGVRAGSRTSRGSA